MKCIVLNHAVKHSSLRLCMCQIWWKFISNFQNYSNLYKWLTVFTGY